MLVRIVKLTFKKEHVASFRLIFEETKHAIRNSEGCELLELYQDRNRPEIFFTYSYWRNEEYLEQYRQTEFFKSVWKRTKLLFEGKPEVWSLTKLSSLRGNNF